VRLDGKLLAVLEVSLFETAFFVSAWLLERGGGYGWYSKTVMIILGLAGLALHGLKGRYSPLPRNLARSLLWSAAVAALLLGGALAAIAASALAGTLRPVDPLAVLVDLAWFTVFVGFAEELFFRGYVQARLNEAFDSTYGSFLGVRFEWHQGTLITGVLFFGLPHLLTGVNPFTGYFHVGAATILMTLSACFMGVVWGVLKEETGGIILPAVFHGLLDFATFSVARATGIMFSAAAVGAALFLFFTYLLPRMLQEEEPAAPRARGFTSTPRGRPR